jgi:trimeric autotransporter adhesin
MRRNNYIKFCKAFVFKILFSVICINAIAQDECSSAVSLTSATGCNNTSINLATATSNAATPLGCFAAGTYLDYWYSFTAVSTSHTVTLSVNGGNGARITDPRVQIYSGTCGSLTSIVCGNTTGFPVTATATSLTIGQTYYVRIAQLGALGGTGNARADLCITHPIAPPANDDCSGSTLLTSGTSCTNVASSLFYATPSSGTIPSGCSISGTVYEVWFRYVATATSQIVNVSSLGSGLSGASTYVQMMSSSNGLCTGTLTSLGCSPASSTLSVSSLTIGTTYYIRVFVQTSPVGITSSVYGFNICVQQAGGNNLCPNAQELISSTTCNPVSGTLNGSTTSASLLGGTCGVANASDVWYSFVAQSTNPTIIFTNNGIPRNSTNRASIQLLSGICGSLTHISCADRNDAFGTAYNLTTSGLTIGTRYYIRIYSNQTTVPTSTWTFTICVRDPSNSFTVETAKSYVNISKQNGGGSIVFGNVLEIRTTLSLSLGTIDSLSFQDTLKSGAGFGYQTGTVALRTNEGKIFPIGGSAYTDASGDDGGFAVGGGIGTDTIIRINIGTGATSARGGSVSAASSQPRTAAGNYLVMATYRVVVNQPEGTRINFGGGSFRFRNPTTGVFSVISFPRDSLIVYNSPDICPNAISSTNVIGDEYNGTFGSQSGASPIHNRAPSPNTNYVYRTFTTGTPNDNYYGITSNTSSTSTVTNRNLPIPTANTNRVFGVWDISGDHTDATDQDRGNPPCNTSLPVSPTNPCGFMMVFNAAYKTDTAFQFNVANACPNTFYEVAAWFKNVCYKCGQDAEGEGQWSGAAYNPTGTNDTSGVKPNIAIKVNNLDYYTTGDIQYTSAGVPRLSTTADTANRWVRRAFVYRTDSTTTNFTLTLRNNAPGGGGNDWAIDDISFKTCSPTLELTPSANTTFCENNQVNMQVRVASYYNMYQYYQWERSTDGGNTWAPAPEAPSVQSFTYTSVSGEYRDSVNYPSIIANSTTNGYRYRIRVATTAAGITNSCAVFNTDDVIVINLASSGCNVLPTEVLKFNAQLNGDKTTLTWQAREDGLKGYEVERSNDGIHFKSIGYVYAIGTTGKEVSYLMNDPVAVSGKVFYRLKLENTIGNNTYSNTLTVSLALQENINISNLVNPFMERISFQLNAVRNEEIQLELTDALGKPILQKRIQVYKGSNAVAFSAPQYLSKGSYLLRIVSTTGTINKIIQKQ